jgi:hypothetical protein
MTEENQIATTNNKVDLMEVINSGQDLSLALMFNEDLFKRCSTIAQTMAKAVGIIPQHLIGKPETCFAVVTRSILWKLDPFSVAGSTYDVKGNHGYEGKLCRAILEKSGRFEERLRFEKLPNAEAWTKIQGKHKVMESTKKTDDNGRPTKFATSNWSDKDEEGLGVRIHYKMNGEEAKTFDFYLRQAYPRNSTLWATDPWTQLCYLASRRFANSEVPDIFMGVPFDKENVSDVEMQDVTPSKPTPNRRAADDINEILQKGQNAPENKQPESKQEKPTGDGGKAKDEAGAATQPPEKSAAQLKAETILNELKECGKDGDKAQEIFDRELDHIFMLPQDLQDPIHEIMNGFKQ